MSSERSSPGAAPAPAAARPDDRFLDMFNPRRSLSARLLWTVLPIGLLPAAFYWLSADRLLGKSELELTGLLYDAAVEAERADLRFGADARLRELADQQERVVAVLHDAAREAGAALEAGPNPDLPAEPLVDDPDGALYTAGGGASAALVSRAAGLSAAVRRDLAATRRLEGSFSALAVGPIDVSAAYVLTASGVFRAVPGLDMRRIVKEGGMSAAFAFPSRWTRPLTEAAADGASPVAWTTAYEDFYAHKGQIITAVTLLRSRTGQLLGEVGVDWVFTELFTRAPGSLRPGEIEALYGSDGALLVIEPSHATPPESSALLEALGARRQADAEVLVGAAPHLAAVRRVPALGWIYVRAFPRSALHQVVDAQVRPIFGAAREQRRGLRLLYMLVIAGLAVVLVVVTRRAVAPIRRVARAADAITAGREATELVGTTGDDELSRLSRAMVNLDRRIRRRVRSMDGFHRLAQAASVMTRPEETYARLTREIATMVGAGKAFLCLWEPETRTLALIVPGYGISDDSLEGRRIGLSDQSLAIMCYRTGEMYVVEDVRSDSRVSTALRDALEIERNIVFAPLRAEVGILGVLAVADKPEGFDAEDQAAIEGYADQAALLLRNSRLYDELQRSYERLRDANRNRDYFLQNINHELRTPLTAILGWSEVLAEDRPDAETVTTAVEQIRRSAQFLLALISDLLDLSRFEEGGIKLEPEDVDLASVVAEAVEPVAVMAEGKGIAVEVAAPPRGAVSVRIDPMRTRQVLWNLVHNAVKFTPKGGRIRVEAAADREATWFTVTDDGVGIDPKDLPFIFERFRQADGSTTRAYRGMGIGLALVKAYVELHGGRISVESQPGRGTVFRIRIPRLEGAAAAEAT